MDKPSMAEQVGRAASEFVVARTGHAPKGVTVVLTANTLVITLQEALSAAEVAHARTPTGAAQVQEFHRQLFATTSEPLREEIKRITGVIVREATVAQVFATGAIVQVFLLDRSLPMQTWSGPVS
jgi:uncharacterized protein YbcI